jgi:hypothetical protein
MNLFLFFVFVCFCGSTSSLFCSSLNSNSNSNEIVQTAFESKLTEFISNLNECSHTIGLTCSIVKNNTAIFERGFGYKTWTNKSNSNNSTQSKTNFNATNNPISTDEAAPIVQNNDLNTKHHIEHQSNYDHDNEQIASDHQQTQHMDDETNENDYIDEFTLFGIGSLTKSFTVTLLAKLIDQQQLTWDTKINDILPEFKVADLWTNERLTIRDLLGKQKQKTNPNLYISTFICIEIKLYFNFGLLFYCL